MVVGECATIEQRFSDQVLVGLVEFYGTTCCQDLCEADIIIIIIIDLLSNFEIVTQKGNDLLQRR